MYESQLFSLFAPIGRLELNFAPTRRSNDEKQNGSQPFSDPELFLLFLDNFLRWIVFPLVD